MDYKKKYEGLMKNIEHLHKSVNPEWKRIIECYIPELKESEDEKIRKNLRDFLLDAPSQDIVSHYLDLEKTLNWLEKQGEQKFSSLSEKEIVCLKRILDFLRKEHNSYTGEDFTNEIVVLEWLITHPVLIHSSELQQNQGVQNPAWSEEDERIKDNCIGYIEASCLCHKEFIECIDWLKSLKERVQPKQEWSEEDEYMLNFYEKDYNNLLGDWKAKDVIERRMQFRKWLKSLKYRMKGEIHT